MLMSILAVAWQWLELWAAAQRSSRPDAFRGGIERAAAYWLRTELPRVHTLADLCESAEASYLDVRPAELGLVE